MIDAFDAAVPVSSKGFGLGIDHYSNGRVAMAVVGHGGLGLVRYYGKQYHGKNVLFTGSDLATSSFGKLMRLHVIIDDAAYFPEFQNTRHYPFGFVSECVLCGVRVQHEIILDNDTLFQRVKVLDNPEGKAVRARILMHGHLFNRIAGREIKMWEINEADGTMSAEILDDENGTPVINRVKLGTLSACNTYSRHGSFKYYMEATTPADETVFYLAFNPESGADFSASRIDRRIAWYEKLKNEGAQFDSGNPMLDSALSNSVPTIASLAIPDSPGAIKASQSYWVWGWDSMVHAETLLWNGQAGLVRHMLEFYKKTADPKKGIAHALLSDFGFLHEMAPSAQCLYVVMLYNYYAATGDKETLDRYLPFAKEVLINAGKAKRKGGALSVGLGFFPDCPQLFEQTHDDISLANNSLYFQALAAINDLCGEFGDEVAALKEDMENMLWDYQEKYWIDSANGNDFSKRKFYPLFGQFFVSPFGSDPRAGDANAIAKFMREHFLTEFGMYMYPEDKPGFMADGNQMGAYYPPIDRYYWNIMNLDKHTESAADFERIVTHFWKEHSYPEGLTHETVNEDPTTDNPGCKQAFTAKGWFCDALELQFGLRVFVKGIKLNPLPSSRPFAVRNLHLRGKLLHIRRKGAGKTPKILLNGNAIENALIPWDKLSEAENTIEIEMQ